MSRPAAPAVEVDTARLPLLLGELRRWGVLPGPLAEELLPHADRAMTWIERYGDLDGDGFVE